MIKSFEIKDYLKAMNRKDMKNVVKGLYEFVNVTEDANDAVVPLEVAKALKSAGNRCGKYVLIERIAEGGGGKVYKGYDKELKRYVALKFLKTVLPESKERFIREAETVASLRHPNIITIYDIQKRDTGEFYIVTQYINGVTIDKAREEMPLESIIKAVIKVCDALSFAHSKGVIHRDIKPGNIMIDSEGEPFILDFGIAKQTGSHLTMTNEIVGTPHFTSPENIKGEKVDQRSDIYSLGATLYYCVTGVTSFDGRTPAELLNNILEKEPVPPDRLNPLIGNDLKHIIQKCMAKDPAFRYADVDEVRDDLERYLSGDTVAATSGSLGYFLKRYGKKHRNAIIAVAMLVVLSAVVGVPLYRSLKSSAKQEAIRAAVMARQKAMPFFESGRNYLERVRNSTSTQMLSKANEYISKAVMMFTRAIETDKTYAEAYLARGELYFWMEEPEKAVSDISMAIENAPELSHAYFMRILINCLRGFSDHPYTGRPDIASVKRDSNKLKELGMITSKIRGVEALITITEGGSLHEAGKIITDAIREDPGCLYCYIIRGAIRMLKYRNSPSSEFRSRMSRLAIDDFRKASEIDPSIITNYINIAGISVETGNLDLAMENLRIARKILPDDPRLIVMEAIVYLGRGNASKAKELAEMTVAMEGNITSDMKLLSFYIDRGCVWFRLGMKEQATEDFDKAVGLAPYYMKDDIQKNIEFLTR